MVRKKNFRVTLEQGLRNRIWPSAEGRIGVETMKKEHLWNALNMLRGRMTSFWRFESSPTARVVAAWIAIFKEELRVRGEEVFDRSHDFSPARKIPLTRRYIYIVTVQPSGRALGYELSMKAAKERVDRLAAGRRTRITRVVAGSDDARRVEVR